MVTSAVGMELELVQKVKCYQLDIVGLTSMHSLGSGTKLLVRGWTLLFSGVPQGITGHRAGMGILTSTRHCTTVLGFSFVNKRVASVWYCVAGGNTLNSGGFQVWLSRGSFNSANRNRQARGTTLRSVPLWKRQDWRIQRNPGTFPLQKSLR